MDYILLGTMIKEARCNAGFTQNDIATLLMVTFQNVSSWERGKSKIDIDTLIKICQLYKIDVLELLKKVSSIHNANENNLSNDKTELIENYDSLNEVGQQILLEQSKMMTENNMYKKTIKYVDVQKNA